MKNSALYKVYHVSLLKALARNSQSNQASLVVYCVHVLAHTSSPHLSGHTASSWKHSFDETPEGQGVLQLMEFLDESIDLCTNEMQKWNQELLCTCDKSTLQYASKSTCVSCRATGDTPSEF